MYLEIPEQHKSQIEFIVKFLVETEQIERFKKKLSSLLEALENNASYVDISEKASDLLIEYERVFSDSKIITDINQSSIYLLKQAEIKENFIKLANQWRRETKHMSLMSDIISHTAYQQIIGMGKDAIPLILEELSQKPEHWFWALRCITRVNPIKQEDRGRIKKMAAAWLNWGRQHGYRC